MSVRMADLLCLGLRHGCFRRDCLTNGALNFRDGGLQNVEDADVEFNFFEYSGARLGHTYEYAKSGYLAGFLWRALPSALMASLKAA